MALPFGMLVVWPCVGSFLTGVGVLIWQSSQWLQYAAWPNLMLRDGLKWWYGPSMSVSTGWLGVDKIVDGSPLVLWLMLLFPIAWMAMGIMTFNLVFRGPPTREHRRSQRPLS